MPCCDSHTEDTGYDKPNLSKLHEKATTVCGGPGCLVTLENIKEMFPTLKVLPRPEPSTNDLQDHKNWLEESEQWSSLRCKCGRGYFCREHGDWISGEEVGSGEAVAGDQQQPGACPGSHYEDFHRQSYVGQRDSPRIGVSG
ncbi:hypothetical protein FDECE_1454 [Fusarium decemcellulare]|nr:hypothetical protein FDECE_1454 [Fusarium decemcellulare]